MIVTVRVEQLLSKQEILQHYLNTSYFGRGAYGIEVAANAYFGKHVQELTPHQAAVLAALLRAPSNYDPAAKEGNLERLEGRYRYVLRGMAEMGVIPTSDVEAPLPKIRPVADKRTYEGPRGHLLVQVRKELRKIGFTDQQIEQLNDAFKDAIELASYVIRLPRSSVDPILAKYFNAEDFETVLGKSYSHAQLAKVY